MWILYGIISLIVLLSALWDMWMKESLSFFIPKYETQWERNKTVTLMFYALCIQTLSAIVLFFIFFVWAPFIANQYFENPESIKIVQVFAFFFLGINFFQLLNNFFLAVQNTFMQKITEFFRMITVLLIVLVIFIFDLWSLYSYSFAWLGGLYFWVFVSLVVFLKKYYKTYFASAQISISSSHLKEVFWYAIIILFASQSTLILSQVDMVMVISLLGTQAAGYYTNYLSLVSIPHIFLWPIFLILLPIISELFAKKKYTDIKKIKEVFYKITLILISWSSVFLFLLGPEVSTFLFGEKFLVSGEILQYSIMFIIFNFFLTFNYTILNTTGKSAERLYIIIFMIFINIALNFWWIHSLWVYGAALATGVGWLMIWILTEWRTPNYRISLPLGFIIWSISPLVVIILLYFFVFSWLLPDLDRAGTGLYLIWVASMFFWVFFLLYKKHVSFLFQQISIYRWKK